MSANTHIHFLNMAKLGLEYRNHKYCASQSNDISNPIDGSHSNSGARSQTQNCLDSTRSMPVFNPTSDLNMNTECTTTKRCSACNFQVNATLTTHTSRHPDSPKKEAQAKRATSNNGWRSCALEQSHRGDTVDNDSGWRLATDSIFEVWKTVIENRLQQSVPQLVFAHVKIPMLGQKKKIAT